MPDVTVLGGLTELKKVSAMAEARGVATAPHGPFGPVTIAAQVHAMAADPNFLILEYAWGEVPWRQQLTDPGELVVDGRIALPQGPGLGLALNRQTVEEHLVVDQA